MMNINTVRGDLTDIQAKTEALVAAGAKHDNNITQTQLDGNDTLPASDDIPRDNSLTDRFCAVGTCAGEGSYSATVHCQLIEAAARVVLQDPAMHSQLLTELSNNMQVCQFYATELV